MLLQGDATRLPFPDESIHCIVTSPPYNANIDYPGYDDNMSWFDYEEMAIAAAAEMYRVLVPGGRAWINVQPVVPIAPGDNSRRYPLLVLWEAVLGTAEFQFRDVITWIQDSHDGACAWGSWLRPSAPNTRGGWEAILSVYKETWARKPPEGWKDWRAPRDELGGSWMDLTRNVWKMAPVPRRAGPACFPMELPARCIRLSTWPTEIVMDPFVGTGTTVRAAEALGRRAIGIDLDATFLYTETTSD